MPLSTAAAPHIAAVTPLDLRVESLLWRPRLAVEGPDELVRKQVAARCCCHEEGRDGAVCLGSYVITQGHRVDNATVDEATNVLAGCSLERSASGCQFVMG